MSASSLISYASASSKVLLAGGYLILDPSYTGIVIALNARFHTHIKTIPSNGNNNNNYSIIVFSPQHYNTLYYYDLKWELGKERWTLTSLNNKQEQNKFVELSILYSLLYLSCCFSTQHILNHLQSGFKIYLEGDPSFYSGSSSSTKTGLGSSAALVSSLVAALFYHFGGLEDNSITIAHNLSQFIHCAAQGKIGSGFDISTAFYGSQIYKRFHPSIIEDLVIDASKGIQEDYIYTTIHSTIFMKRMHPSKWNYAVSSFHLPPGLVLLLGDVVGGSSTPMMVKKVLESNIDKQIWKNLNESNSKVESILHDMNQISLSNPIEYHMIREKLSIIHPAEWSLIHSDSRMEQSILNLFARLHSTFFYVRHYLRLIGQLSSVDIEPLDQTKLLDCSLHCPGVAIAGVPGAGGNDAIFALVLSEEAGERLEALWKNFVRIRRLPVRQETSTILYGPSNKDEKEWNF